MRLPAQQFWAVASNAALEIVRQPLYLLLATAMVALAGLLPVLSIFTFGEEGKLVRDGIMALYFVFGVAMAGLAASCTLYAEVRNGTAAAVLCKPVNRNVFFLAKFMGVLLALATFSTMAWIAALLGVRMATPLYQVDEVAGLLIAAPLGLAYALAGLSNFFLKRPFVSQASFLLLVFLLAALIPGAWLERSGAIAFQKTLLPWRLLPACLLIGLGIVVLSAIALSLSTRCRPSFTLLLAGLCFLAGLMSDYFFGRHAGTSRLSSLLYTVIPNLQHFWVIDALNGGGTIPWGYVLYAAGYAACMTAGLLCLGMLSFRSVDIA